MKRDYGEIEIKPGEYPIGLRCCRKNECEMKALIFTTDKNILRDWRNSLTSDGRLRFMDHCFLDIDYGPRKDVNRYSRVIFSKFSEHTCEALPLKTGISIFVVDRILSRTSYPVSVEQEIDEMSSCPLLSRIGLEEEKVRKICDYRNKKLRQENKTKYVKEGNGINIRSISSSFL